MLLPLYELFKFGIAFFALVRIAPYAKPRREGKKRVITASLSVLIFAASWILSATVSPPEAVFLLMGNEKWVRRNVDVDAIQTWLLSKEVDPHLEKCYDFANPPDDLPHFVTDFGPKYIVFSGYRSEEERSVTFEWGGGLEHWGFVVGLPTMKAKQKGRIQHGGHVVEYRRPIKPGVYVYDGG